MAGYGRGSASRASSSAEDPIEVDDDDAPPHGWHEDDAMGAEDDEAGDDADIPVDEGETGPPQADAPPPSGENETDRWTYHLNPWAILELSQPPRSFTGHLDQAALDAIDRAYRRLARDYHPDKRQAGADHEQATAQMASIEAAKAQEELRRRAAYTKRLDSAVTAIGGW